LIKNYH